MELIHAAILLHEAGKEISETNLKGVLNAAGIKKDDSQLKALVAALDGVNIDEAIKESAMPVAQPVATTAKKEEAKEEKKESKQEAAVGLGALFG
ncbi:MAG: 50S ribosomal protein L12 [Candidatus Nanoarchaeia archaeon]|jgi:large subunit ribosomal protein L12|nr:50S ribosomal protein L12 [Candidatus Nanoarchaeia archaeon]